MIIRQSFVDSSGRHHIKDIDIRMEEMRINREPISEIKILASYDDHTSMISPNDKITSLLDAKRTFVPYQCHQSCLTKKTTSNIIEIYDNDELNGQMDDPVVILSDIYGAKKQYCLIKAITGNKLELIGLNTEFFAGAIVQNLANRWWSLPTDLGLCARLSRPEPLPFTVKAKETITVIITTPLNPGIIKCYDVYVRSEKFSTLEHHWIADKANVSLDQDAVITTFNGGMEAGGGLLTSGTYYVTVISKDRIGNNNVNESECIVEEVAIA